MALAGLSGSRAVAQSVDPAPVLPDYQPLTSAQRWDRYFNGTLLSSTLYGASFGAALVDHLHHDPPEWRQGFAGYTRRSASEYGLHVIDATVHQGAAAALGYDPRYRHCDCSGFFRRSAHAIKWSFVTRNSAGQTRFDLPVMAGSYGGGMLSTMWYPHRYNALSDGVRVGNKEVGLHVGLNILHEFGPELKRAFHLKN